MFTLKEIDCDGVRRLYTVFSCSNYQDSGFKGSILVYESMLASVPPKLIQFDPLEVDSISAAMKLKKKLVDLICMHKPALMKAMEFESSMSLVSVATWATIMQRILKLEVDFTKLLSILAGDSVSDDGKFINTSRFASLYHVDIVCPNGNKIHLSEQGASQFLKNRAFLLVMFRFIDNHKGTTLSREKIKAFSKLLDESRCDDFDHIFDVMHIDKNVKLSLSDVIESWGVTHPTSM